LRPQTYIANMFRRRVRASRVRCPGCEQCERFPGYICVNIFHGRLPHHCHVDRPTTRQCSWLLDVNKRRNQQTNKPTNTTDRNTSWGKYRFLTQEFLTKCKLNLYITQKIFMRPLTRPIVRILPEFCAKLWRRLNASRKLRLYRFAYVQLSR